jgi:hypothetical protein
MWLILPILNLIFRNWIWAPSPQSIKNSCSLSLTTCEVGNLIDVGKAELLPRMVTEKEFILPD